MAHVTDMPLLGSIESSLRQAAAAGMVADADFATDLATTLANIVTRNAAIHSTLYPLYLSTLEAVRAGFRVLGATTMITDLATIYAAIDGDWSPGFSVAL